MIDDADRAAEDILKEFSLLASALVADALKQDLVHRSSYLYGREDLGALKTLLDEVTVFHESVPKLHSPALLAMAKKMYGYLRARARALAVVSLTRADYWAAAATSAANDTVFVSSLCDEYVRLYRHYLEGGGAPSILSELGTETYVDSDSGTIKSSLTDA